MSLKCDNSGSNVGNGGTMAVSDSLNDLRRYTITIDRVCSKIEFF